ncbi:MAG TPA: DUF1109 domain-containing protein [Rhizomicrobium sp.]|jgi:hypothetical protein|nr:DUF1109 domain-containing protein [Rhizomicrobium sp.]
MKTEALIERLSEQAPPARPGLAPRVVAASLAAGGAVSFALMLVWLGLRPDLSEAAATSAYWMKFFYTLLFAASAGWTLTRLAQPGAPALRQSLLEIAPFAALAAWSAMRLVNAPEEARMPLLMGASHQVCPWRIAALSLPILAALLLGLRRLAPTRPTLAGLAAGLTAGAAGAFVYAFHCDESAAPFVALWYTLGIAAVGALGALLGRHLLRW